MAKATAAIRGIKLKDFIAESIVSHADDRVKSQNPQHGIDEPIPFLISPAGRIIPSRTQAEIEELLDQPETEGTAVGRSA